MEKEQEEEEAEEEGEWKSCRNRRRKLIGGRGGGGRLRYGGLGAYLGKEGGTEECKVSGDIKGNETQKEDQWEQNKEMKKTAQSSCNASRYRLT